MHPLDMPVVARAQLTPPLAPLTDSLPELAQHIRAEHAAVIQSANDVLAHVLVDGRALIAARKLVPEGEWGFWLRRYCNVSDRHARRYIALAHAYEASGDLVGLSLPGLLQHGPAVVASDIVDHGFPLQFVGDFLTQTKMAFGTERIVTDPTYLLVEEFVARALELAPLGSCCCASLFLSARRGGMLEGRGLKRVQVFRNRLAPRRPERLQSLRFPGSSGRAGIAV